MLIFYPIVTDDVDFHK